MAIHDFFHSDAMYVARFVIGGVGLVVYLAFILPRKTKVRRHE